MGEGQGKVSDMPLPIVYHHSGAQCVESFQNMACGPMLRYTCLQGLCYPGPRHPTSVQESRALVTCRFGPYKVVLWFYRLQGAGSLGPLEGFCFL